MPRALNHPTQVEVIYALICMLLGKHEILLFCHLKQSVKEGYITYTQLLILLLLVQRSYFLNAVPLSLSILMDPPNLE